jgi:hypothetical protein
MKVQKGIIPETNCQCWMVLDDDYLPIDPISKYLNYLDSLERSPNTIAILGILKRQTTGLDADRPREPSRFHPLAEKP